MIYKCKTSNNWLHKYSTQYLVEAPLRVITIYLDRSASDLDMLLCKTAPTLSSYMGTVIEQHLLSPDTIVNWIEVQTLTWPIQDIYTFVFKPFLCGFRFVFGVVVLLENKSPKSHFSCRLQKVFLQVLCCIHFHSTFTTLSGPAADKHPHSMMLLPPCFTVGMVCFWRLVWWPKSSILP